MHAYRSRTKAALDADVVGEIGSFSGCGYRKRKYGGVFFLGLRDHLGLT